ncbi:hypothetical protein MAR_037192, partial [Mya arenaria]
PDYPCGSCGNEVLDSDHAVECDKCNTSFHITCQNLGTNWYTQLVENDLSFYVCIDNNSFNSLVDDNIPTQNSLPTYPQQNNKSIPKQPRFVVNKKHELQNLIYNENPDIVAGTESWLKNDHYTSEFFPPFLGYTAFRNDILKGKGGGCKPMYISSYYMPHESDLQSLLELEKSLDLVSKLKGTKLILGDFNFPKLTWDSEHTPHLKPSFSPSTVYDKFLDIINDQNMTQMVSENTRNDNILDIFLTTNLTFVDKVNIIPGISDHDIISTIVNARPNILKQKPRIVPLYRKANWDDFKQFMNTTQSDILQGSDSLSVEEIWLNFTDAIEGDKLYTKLKKIRTNSNINNIFKSLKATIKSKIKTSHLTNIENILDIANNEQSVDNPG